MPSLKKINHFSIVNTPIKYLYHCAVDSDHIRELPVITVKNNCLATQKIIYCIHGSSSLPRVFNNFNSCLTQLLSLQWSNFSIHTPQFHNRFQGESIEGFAHQLLEYIFAHNHQNKEIILIGHSRGGLVAAYLTEVLVKQHNINITKVFTIATPFKGCKSAKVPIPFLPENASLHQMRQDSNFLQNLTYLVSQNPSKYNHYIGCDDRVIVHESAHPYHNHTHLKLKNFHIFCGEHTSVLNNPKLAENIASTLTNTTNYIYYNSYNFQHSKL